jgi:hypothetical protein
MLIIDCHCHAGRGDALTAPWNTTRLEPTCAARKSWHHAHDCFPAFHSDYVVANANWPACRCTS